MDGGHLASVECTLVPASGRYLHSAEEETLYAIRKMQCNKLHQGFTSHDARLHFSLTNEYLSFSGMKKHSKPSWANFFPLLRSVFWGLMVLSGGGLSWGATSFLKVCVHCRFSCLESADHALVSGVWSWWGHLSLRCWVSWGRQALAGQGAFCPP